MNTYKTSSGERITKAKIIRNISYAKELKLKRFKNDHGYYFCEDCGISKGRIDCSHTISVKHAQDTGRTELAWDLENIILRCRPCHNKLDSKPNHERG